MILDTNLEMLDAVALNTGAPGGFILGNQADLGGPTLTSALRDIGTGGDTYLVVTVDTTATSGGSATLQLNLVSDDNAALASPRVHITTKAFPVASLVAGATLAVIPIPGDDYERYVGIQQVTGVAAFTGGKINAFIVKDAAKWKALADAFPGNTL